MNNKEKFKELIKNEDFITEILELQTEEEVQEKFRENGIEISTEEIQLFGDALNNMIDNEKSEISEEDLKIISGGNSVQEAEFFEENSDENAHLEVSPVINSIHSFAHWIAKKD